MKLIAIAVIALSASLNAQTPAQKAQAAHAAGQPTPAQQAAQANPPAATPAPPPGPPAEQLEPKHSEATATLRAVEAEKHDLLTQQQSVMNQVNTIVGSLRTQITSKEKEASDQEEKIRQENGWGPDVQYIAPQPQQDGTMSQGKWQKTVKK